MNSRRRTAILAGSTALMVVLSGCALLEPRVEEVVLSDTARCTMGHTWTLDTVDLSSQLLAELTRDHPSVTGVEAEGKRTLEWGNDHVLKLKTDLSVTVTLGPAETPTTITRTDSGAAGGKAYINGTVAIPRDWDSDVDVDLVARTGETELESAPFRLPSFGISDVVGLELTCDGSTLKIRPRGAPVTQTWTR